MRYVSVARVSTEAQTDNTSLETQTATIQSFGTRLGLECVASFTDTASGSEAGLRDREGLRKALGYLDEGKAEILITYDVSRAGRETSVVKELIKQIYSKGAKLGVASEGRVFDSASEARKALFWTANVAEYEWMQIQERTSRGRIAAMRQGAWTQAVPYGYRTAKLNNVKKLVPDEYEASMLHKVYQLILDGKTRGEISRYMNQVDGRRRWSTTAVSNAINRIDFYSGITVEQRYTVDGQETVVPYEVPPIIDAELLKRLKPAVKTNQKRGGRVVPYQGTTKCSCGEDTYVNCTYKQKDGTVVFSLGCASYNRRLQHQSRGLTYDKPYCKGSVAHTKIDKVLREALSRTDVKDISETALASLMESLSIKQNEFAAVKENRDSITDALLNSSFTNINQVIEDKLKQLIEEESKLTRQIVALEKSIGLIKNRAVTNNEELLNLLNQRDYSRLNKMLAETGITITINGMVHPVQVFIGLTAEMSTVL